MTDSTIALPRSTFPRVIADRYELGAPLGEGATGAVYEATDLRSGREVAIKVLLPDLAGAADVAERFRREARAARLLDHPNIVAALDLVADGDRLCLVMELARGESVRALLERGDLGARRALVIARQVLEGLAHAHAAGLIHRDLKPENVVVVRAGEPGREHDRARILDFGLVKLVGEAAQLLGDERLTRTGLVFGTPAYMSPEQAASRPVDPRADLYSLGVMLFELLTGRLPYRSPDPLTLLRMHAAAPVPSLASAAPGQPWCTPALEALVRGALAKAPEQRFADAAAMRDALDAAFGSLDHLAAGA